MKSPNCLDLEMQFAGTPVSLRMGAKEYLARSNWYVSRHCNADFEVHILLSGSCVLEAGSQNIALRAPQAVLIAPGTYHCPHDLSEDFEWFCFSFMPAQQAFSQRLAAQVHTAVTCSLPPEAGTLCRMVWEEISAAHPFQEDSIRALFTQLLVMLFRETHLECAKNTTPVNAATWRTAIIDEFFSPLNCPHGTEEELAAMLNLSRRQLNRVLIKNYGMGYREKMFQTRMEYAGSLLQTTEQRAGQIGLLVGYTSESSFYKAFQSYFQMTPQQYRFSKVGKE